MCGISGIYRFDGKKVLENNIVEQINCMRHRGPDSEGVFVKDHLGLGHVRLSIIDLSECGAQPMIDNTGNYALSYNGETYNYDELRASLAHEITYVGESDTEVILHGLIQNSTDFIRRMEGMFAFAFYDIRKDELILARDPFGIKPLYYHKTKDRLVFSSEIKPLLQDKGVKVVPNQEAIKEHLVLGYALEPNTAFAEIYKLSPGHVMTVDRSGIHIKKYWDISELIDTNNSSFGQEFNESVLMHTKSDVPLGMFLSGGFDSNLILQSLAKQGKVDAEFKAYNVGSDYEKEDSVGNLASERSIAKLSAAKFKAELVEINVGDKENQFISFSEAIRTVEEPICNPSNILIDFICKRARKNGNKVLLSGHGGDEIFGGYRRHVAIKNLKYLKNPLGKLLLRLMRPKIGDNLYYRLSKATKSGNNKPHLDLISLGADTIMEYDCLGDFITESDLEKIRKKIDYLISPYKEQSLLKQMMILDFLTYLSAQNLINMDKFSMKNSVEVRVPFLYKSLVSYGLSLNDNELVKGFKNKVVIREFAKNNLPKEIQNTKKSGFSPSLVDLSRSTEVKELLFGNRTVDRGMFKQKNLKKFYGKNANFSESDAMVILNYAYVEQWYRSFADSKKEGRWE